MDHWVNKKNLVFGTDIITKPIIFYLYGYLGDGFNIVQKNFIENLEHTKKGNPNWEVRILRENHDQLDLFIKNYLPDYYSMYKNYPYPIQKCDIIRYILMYLIGGVYSDLDVRINININKLLNKYRNYNVILGVGRIKDLNKCMIATTNESIRGGETELPIKIANYFFISRKRNHPIWLDILELAKIRSTKKVISQYGIIYSTGPDLVTTAIHNNINKYNDVKIINIKEFKKIIKHQCSSSWRVNLQECEGNQNTT